MILWPDLYLCCDQSCAKNWDKASVSMWTLLSFLSNQTISLRIWKQTIKKKKSHYCLSSLKFFSLRLLEYWKRGPGGDDSRDYPWRSSKPSCRRPWTTLTLEGGPYLSANWNRWLQLCLPRLVVLWFHDKMSHAKPRLRQLKFVLVFHSIYWFQTSIWEGKWATNSFLCDTSYLLSIRHKYYSCLPF